MADHKHDGHSHDDHSHHHNHSHGHHHHPLTDGNGQVLRGLKLVFFLNLGFAIFELIGGIMTNSVAVMSDALHDFGDASALGLAWYLEKKSVQKATESYTYGFRRLSLLSSLFTGGILLVGSVFIIHECIQRLLNPQPVVALGMVGMAVVGILVNGWGLFQFNKTGGANERMIRLHLIEDVSGWVVVLFAGILLNFVDVPWLDSLIGAGISLWIIFNVIRQLVSVSKIFLQALPEGLKISEIEDLLKTQQGIQNCHHTHIWSLDGEKHILTTHLKLESDIDLKECPRIKSSIKTLLKEKFSIFEATIEIEFSDENCNDDPVH